MCRKCRIYHIHIGPMSIRLRPDAFEGLYAVLADVHYESEARKLAPVATLHSH